jgi:proteasome maturation protein
MLVFKLLPLIMNLSRIFAIQNPHMPAMAQSNIHLDILEGRDETLDVSDFFRRSS